MNKKEENKHEKSLVRNELKLEIMKTFANFKSREVKSYEIDNTDILYVLSSLLTRKLE